jgi:hypothetical protein
MPTDATTGSGERMTERREAAGPATPPPSPPAAAGPVPAPSPEQRSALSPATLPPPARPKSADRRLDRLPGHPFEPARLVAPPADPARAAALAAAVGCPDLYHLVARPGPARDAFVREYAAETTGAGERLLVLAPTAAAAARLARLLPDAVFAGDADGLTTSAAAGAGQVAAARRALADAERAAADALERTAAADPAWGTLRDAVGRMAEADADARRLADERDRLPEAVRAEADAPGTPLAAELARLAVPAELADRRAKAEATLAAAREAWKQVGPLADAKKTGRLGFLKGLFAGDVVARAAELEEQVRQAEATLGRAEAEVLAAEAAARDGRLAAEVARRAAELAARADGARGRRAAAEAEFRAAAAVVAAAGLTPPPAPTPDAVADAAAAADDARRQAEARRAAAREEIEALDADPDEAARRLLARRAVVVTPADALDDPAVTAARFDRVLVEAVEAVPDAAVAAVPAHADRWLFVGDGAAGPGPAARACSALPRPPWTRDGGRLVCELERLPVDGCEPVADRPEVELRFGTRADGSPAVAAVAFPADWSPADAEAFLAAELGEPRPAVGGGCRWHEAADGLRATWGWAAEADGRWAAVGPGVWECVTAADGLPRTAAVRFDPDAGWTRERAEAWVADHTAAARAARVAVL